MGKSDGNLLPILIKKISIIEANYVFIDGMCKSGKLGVAPVVSSFNRVEHYKVRATFDRFLMVYESGDLSKQGFKYLFESDLLMDIWFSMMGRDVNNNIHDLTSIINSHKKKIYIPILFMGLLFIAIYYNRLRFI